VGPLLDAGSIVTTGIGGLQTVLEQFRVLTEKGPARVSPFMVPMMMPNAATAAVSMRFGLGGRVRRSRPRARPARTPSATPRDSSRAEEAPSRLLAAPKR